MPRSRDILQEEKPRMNVLSLIISSVALTAVFLFFLPWLTVEDNLSGIDIASSTTQTLPQLDSFPNGIVFILPLVLGSILFQYYRRLWDTNRPRRRMTTIIMLIIGIMATLAWVRNYAIDTSDMLNGNKDISFFEMFDNPALPSPEPVTDGETAQLQQYSVSDVLNEQLTFFLWLHLALSASLVVLPFLDPRPPDAPPEI